MKNMTISFEQPKVMINGMEFSVMKSDVEIVNDMIEMDAELSKPVKKSGQIALKYELLLSYLDKILGEGAREKIQELVADMTGGKSMGAASAVKICESIISAAGKAYADAFKISYGDNI